MNFGKGVGAELKFSLPLLLRTEFAHKIQVILLILLEFGEI
jgi:hypothetical protein